jgi:GNAT superfamily N-acetyltransferase
MHCIFGSALGKLPRWCEMLERAVTWNDSAVFWDDSLHSSPLNGHLDMDPSRPRLAEGIINDLYGGGRTELMPLEVTTLPIRAEETHALRRSVLWPASPHDRTIYHPDDERAYHFGAFINDGTAPKCVSIVSLYVENEDDHATMATVGKGKPAIPTVIRTSQSGEAAPEVDGTTLEEILNDGSEAVMKTGFRHTPQGKRLDESIESFSGSEAPGSQPSTTCEAAGSGRWRQTHFRRFATAPEYQRRGAGNQLLSHVFRFAENELMANSIATHSKVWLRGWYEGYGMRNVGEVWKLFDDELITLVKDFEG